jgi:hypothetical protein
MATSGGPVGQTLLVDGGYPAKPGEPKPVVRIIENRENLIGG